MIRFALILLVALALTVSWQTTLIAANGLEAPSNCASTQGQRGSHGEDCG